MSFPPPIERLWDELQSVRADILREVEGLSQRQADFRPGEKDWSVGEVVHHLTLAEIATGKLTTKLFKESEAAGTLVPFPAALDALGRPPRVTSGPADAPQVVWPEAGKLIGEVIAVMKATRERSRQSMERLAKADPRPLKFKHFRFGDMDLGQWWTLQAEHDGIHLGQIRDIKHAAGFPKS